MGVPELSEVTAGQCSDIYCLDIGLYDTPQYGASYIIDADRPAVVDTGTGTNYNRLSKALTTLGIPHDALDVIALTHVHLDHAGGAGLLASDCPNADVYVHEIGASHLVDPAQLIAGTKHIVGDLWAYHVDPKPIPEHRVVTIGDGDTIDLGERALKTLYVPGHAPHQVAFYDETSKALFPADAVGMWLPAHELATVTTPPPNFNLKTWLDSHETLRNVEADTFLYPHYGPREADNPINQHEGLLKQWVDDIQAKRESMDDDAVIEYFLEHSALREALGDPAGSIPAQFSVQGVMNYLDSQ